MPATTRHPSSAVAAAPKERRRSPNRNRLVARTAVWTIALAIAGFWLPHLF